MGTLPPFPSDVVAVLTIAHGRSFLFCLRIAFDRGLRCLSYAVKQWRWLDGRWRCRLLQLDMATSFARHIPET